MLKVIKQPGGPTDVVVIPDKPTPFLHSLHQEEKEKEQATAYSQAQEQIQAQAKISALREQILQQAEKEAKSLSEALLESANREREEILGQAHTQAQQLFQKAVREGQIQGEQQKKEAVDQVLREVNQLLAQLAQDYQEFIKYYEDSLQSFALEIAEKILCCQIELDKTSMMPLVRQVIGSVKNTDWITVELSSQMSTLINKLKEEINIHEQFDGKHVEIVGKDGRAPGSCVIETPTGLIDASISVQLEKLAEYFEKMR